MTGEGVGFDDGLLEIPTGTKKTDQRTAVFQP